MADEKLLSVRQTARALGVHENTVRNWSSSGRLPTVRNRDSENQSKHFRKFRESDVMTLKAQRTSPPPTYHDLHIRTETVPRTRIADLPYGYQVTCSRVAGWQLWLVAEMTRERLIAGEYDDEWLVLDVNGYVIVDSRPVMADATQ